MLGDAGVGKSNLLLRYTQDKFSESSMSTIGLDLFTKELQIQNSAVLLQLWDTAGQERMRAVTKQYARNAKGIVLVFDITSRDSYTGLKYWMKEVNRSCENTAKILVIGNKTDLIAQREVSAEEASQFCSDRNMFYMETSAKTNRDNCVPIAIESLAQEIFKCLPEKEIADLEAERDLEASTKVEIEQNRREMKSGRRCC